ncbi:Chromosome condensation complex Condensin, subunit H [Handroanthus impetiginosus]|uniref:Condensin complex subunit 2 n=1 Tax=Handroanthus impetiginosus TaxID=429701 RepID=A0A2G9HXV0_9LAMI|nr:Chromosome condensation complex Condensin, subunit H [Handroanthus impetiginosus]
MAEALSPNPKMRVPFSPTKSPFFIGSNDDKLERAQARAARAAAIRRKPAFPTTAASSEADPCLGKEQIIELFQNCIKLASENKINQKNTWELNLIDHLCEIIKVEEENDAETNFQKASCTLEAGVKIYSMRVDSVHSEAYKVLGGINRVGQEYEQDHGIADGNISTEQGENDEKKEQGRKLSPLSTLEPSFAALNVKKIDVAFVVDPLYHQTSAQFDEGGAKGLLLNNLGVYGNCQVLFDSLEVPGKCSSPVSQCEGLETIDLSFASECVEQMVLGMLNKSEISPSLGAIVNQFDKDDQRPTESYSSEQVNESPDSNVDLDGDTFGNSGTWDFDHDDQVSVIDEAAYDQDTVFTSQQEVPDLADEQLNAHDHDEDDRFEEVDSYLFLSLGFSTKQNAWAGPNHWKYRKVKDPEVPADENGSPKPRKTKNKKADLDIDFSNALDIDISLIFAPPKNPKSLLLPANRAPCKTKLPEDCHYQPEDLVKLFLLPNVLCLGKSGKKRTDGESQQRDGYGATASWDDDGGGGFDGGFDDGHAYSDIDESSTLVSQPRQINKVEVQYDKTSKQVDVHELKETLWDHIRQLNPTSVEEEAPEETISFKQVLASFPDSCRAAASLDDISPHLCFICLLHLANEHGLRILGCPTLDDLSIHLKPPTT